MATTDTVTTPAAASNETPAPERFYVYAQLPEELKKLVDKWADDNNSSATHLVRTLLADKLGFDLSSVPETPSRRRHTDERSKLVAHAVASYKSSQYRSTLTRQHKLMMQGKKAEAKALDDVLAGFYAADWAPDAETMAKIEKAVDDKIAKNAPATETPAT